ncbi:solute carrier family 49 member A3-like [Saccoglossus kowalevskii]|uniref:Uncharacterized protein B0416.5-like n=1 Tax=Saccoglossus kowalevskii TaxID=10224 RepID=A0ABM0MBX1_SACKO|nr:PREDICTED: uncharacterized protein B0416.5-like [Saccoglossus kowalevskii]
MAEDESCVGRLVGVEDSDIITNHEQKTMQSFSPAASVVAEYYNTSEENVNLLYMSYVFVSIPMGFVSMWLLDSIGLRLSLLIGAWVNVIGNTLRLMSTLQVVPSSLTFPLVLTGQFIAGSAFPIFTNCPAKVSEQWFSEKERTLSTMITTTGFASILVNILSPMLIEYKGVQFMLIIYGIPALLGVVLTTFGLHSSVPPSPPSASASGNTQPFWTGLKQILKIKQYWIFVVAYGLGGGLGISFGALSEEMMCTHGYTPTFIGLVSALNIGIGIIGSLAASIFVDRTKLFEETAKVTLSLGVVFSSLSMAVSCIPHQEVLIIIFSILNGILLSAAYPVSVELLVENTYPVAEATSLGIVWIISYAMSIASTFMFEALSQPMTPYEEIHQKCTLSNRTPSYIGSIMRKSNITQPKDMTVAMMVYSGLASLQAIWILLFFKSENRRLNTEKSQSIITDLPESVQKSTHVRA